MRIINYKNNKYNIDDMAQLLSAINSEKINKSQSEEELKETIYSTMLFGVQIKDKDLHTAVLKATDQKYLKKQIAQNVRMDIEREELRNGNIGEKTNHYCSKFNQTFRKNQLASNKSYLKSKAVKIDNNYFRLSDISRSNEEKFNEILCVMYALEDRAIREGKTWVMTTLTCPPEMHPNPSRGKNSWDGTMAKEAKDWLVYKWARVRNDLNKKGIKVGDDMYGGSFFESHLDSTPHCHQIVFIDKTNLQTFINVVKKHFNQKKYKTAVDFAINGAIRERKEDLKLIREGKKEPKKVARASSYVCKYVMKSVGFDNTNSEAMYDLDAWRGLNKIRGHQWFGIENCLGKWRLCRKLGFQCKDKDMKDGLLKLAITYAKNTKPEMIKTGRKSKEGKFIYEKKKDENGNVIYNNYFNEFMDLCKLKVVVGYQDDDKKKPIFEKLIKFIKEDEVKDHERIEINGIELKPKTKSKIVGITDSDIYLENQKHEVIDIENTKGGMNNFDAPQTRGTVIHNYPSVKQVDDHINKMIGKIREEKAKRAELERVEDQKEFDEFHSMKLDMFELSEDEIKELNEIFPDQFNK